MSFTAITPANSRFSSTTMPLVFSTTTDTATVTVVIEFLDTGVTETIWFQSQAAPNGRFSTQYASSTTVAGLFTVVRTGGWPLNGAFQLHGVEAAPVAPTPALQPNSYSAVAMYSCFVTGVPGTWSGGDRSGNNYDLPTVTSYGIPDLIPNTVVPITWLSENQATYPNVPLPYGNVASGRIAALEITGAMSITLRCMPLFGQTAAQRAGYQYLFGCGNYGVTAEQPYSLVINKDTSGGGLTYYSNGSGGVNRFDSTLTIPQGAWSFISFRRQTSGVVTIGVDGTYQTSGAINPPAVTDTTIRFGIGRWGAAPDAAAIRPNCGFIGAIADVCVWPRALTDGEVLALRKTAMGIP